MPYQNVKTYFEQMGLADCIIVHMKMGDTVEHDARSLAVLSLG